MWRTGDLRQKLLVLRLVFQEPLVYDRKTGFGTVPCSVILMVDPLPVGVISYSHLPLNMPPVSGIVLTRNREETAAVVIRVILSPEFL